jgi:protein Mpv17
LTAKFTSYYDERPGPSFWLQPLHVTGALLTQCPPVLTMMVTNAILGGIADTVAQVLAAVLARSASLKPGGVSKDDPLSIEVHELDRKDGLLGREYAPATAGPSPFDFERLVRFMAYGFGMAPLQFRWFRFLEVSFPITKESTWGPTMTRVACDQFIMAPFSEFIFPAGPRWRRMHANGQQPLRCSSSS